MNVRNIGDKKGDKSLVSDINVQIDRIAYGELSVLQVSQEDNLSEYQNCIHMNLLNHKNKRNVKRS